MPNITDNAMVKWMSKSPLVAIVVGTVVVTLYISGLLNDADAIRKHLELAPAQDVAIALLKKELEYASAHREKLEKALEELNKHLARLRLVSVNDDESDICSNEGKNANDSQKCGGG